MPDIVILTLLAVEYFCIPVNFLAFFPRMVKLLGNILILLGLVFKHGKAGPVEHYVYGKLFSLLRLLTTLLKEP